MGWGGDIVGVMNCTSGQTLFKEYQIEASRGSMEGKYGGDDNNNLGVSSTYLQRCACNIKFSSVHTLILIL